MHEQSLMDALLKKILQLAQQEQATKVTKVCVKLGALSQLDEAHFKEHFDISAKGTIAEDALILAEMDLDINDPNANFVVLKSIDVAH